MSTELIPISLTKREWKIVIFALKTRQELMEESWASTKTESYRRAMEVLRDIRLSIQKGAKTR